MQGEEIVKKSHIDMEFLTEVIQKMSLDILSQYVHHCNKKL